MIKALIAPADTIPVLPVFRKSGIFQERQAPPFMLANVKYRLQYVAVNALALSGNPHA